MAFKSRAPVEVTTNFSSMSRRPAGREVGSDPVAIMMFLAVIVLCVPSIPSTATVLSPENLPHPFE